MSDQGDSAAAGGALIVVPVTRAQACAFIAGHHRHNKPPTGWKFALGLQHGGALVGVATAGRPVSREIQEREPLTIEVNRTCTDGTRNANSMLYGRTWRAAKAMGYTRAITYTQEGEDGASLRAAGFIPVRELGPRGSWGDHSVTRSRSAAAPSGVRRVLWEIRTAAAKVEDLI